MDEIEEAQLAVFHETTRSLQEQMLSFKDTKDEDGEAFRIAKQNLGAWNVYWRRIRDLKEYMDDEGMNEQQRAEFTASLTEMQPASFPPTPQKLPYRFPKRIEDVQATSTKLQQSS